MQRRQFISLATLLAAFPATLAAAAGPSDRLSLVIGAAPGSTADAVGRALGRGMQAAEPSLQISVEDKESGNGLVAFADCLASTGRGDVIYVMRGALGYSAVLNGRPLPEDLSRVNLIASFGVDQRVVLVSTKTDIQTFDDLLKTSLPLIAPATGATSSGFIESQFLNGLTGSRINAVAGYSSAERKLALLSGEGNVAVGSLDTFQDLIDQGVLRPVLRLNEVGSAARKIEAPLLAAYAHGADSEAVISLIESVSAADLIVVGPPGLATNDIERLTKLVEASAPSVAAAAGPSYGKSEALFAPRSDVTARLGSLLARGEQLASRLREVYDCGTARGAGGACAG